MNKLTNVDYCPLCGGEMMDASCLLCGYHERPLPRKLRPIHYQATKKTKSSLRYGAV